MKPSFKSETAEGELVYEVVIDGTKLEIEFHADVFKELGKSVSVSEKRGFLEGQESRNFESAIRASVDGGWMNKRLLPITVRESK